MKSPNNMSWFGDYAHRWSPGSMPFAYASACVEVALKESKMAQEIYGKIVDAWVNPDVVGPLKKWREQMMACLSDKQKEIFNEGMVNPGKFIKPNNMDEPWDVLKELFSSKPGKLTLDEIEKTSPKEQTKSYEALAEFVLLIFEFVLKGFNRESDIEKGSYKIVPWGDSPWLVLAAMLKAGFYSYLITLSRIIGIYKMGKDKKGRPINFEEILTKKPTSPLHRQMVEDAKKANMFLKHDKVIYQTAERWYMCRVAYSSIEEYLSAEAKKGNDRLDLKNVQKEIKLCDDAFGYLRRN